MIRILGSKYDGLFLPIPEGTHKTPRLRVMCCTKTTRCNVRNLFKFVDPCGCPFTFVTENKMKYLKLFSTFKRHESHVKHQLHWVFSMSIVFVCINSRLVSIYHLYRSTRLSSKRIRCFPVLPGAWPFGAFGRKFGSTFLMMLMIMLGYLIWADIVFSNAMNTWKGEEFVNGSVQFTMCCIQ